MEDRLPAGLWIEAQLRQLDQKAISYYIINKGAYFSGTVILKINGLNGRCNILSQIRNENDKLVWLPPLKDLQVTESDADSYINRSISRDSDVWVIEVESRDFLNPFDQEMT